MIKKQLTRLSVAALTALVFAGTVHAEDPARTVMAYLKIGIDARAAALGDAFVSVADNASANYWNPAGLLSIESMDATFMHNEWLLDLRHEYAGVGFRSGRHAGGVAFVGMFTGDLDRRSETGEDEGTFGFSDNAFSGSYAFQVSDDLGLGITARYLRETINEYVMSGVAFDFGGLWNTPIEHLTAGAALRNVGGELSFDVDDAGSYELPTTLQAGANYVMSDVGPGALLVAADMVVVSGEDNSLRMGAEYTYDNYLSLGVGYKSGLDNEDMSVGIGYTKDVRFHYAFIPLDQDLGSSHRISLGYAW